MALPSKRRLRSVPLLSEEPVRTVQEFRPWTIFVAALLVLQGCGGDAGDARFFDSELYHFQTLRVIGSAAAGGADIGEVHKIVSRITDGDEHSWYRSWNDMGQQLEARARSVQDRRSKGLALLRASNYYRNAIFLLHPRDGKQQETYRRGIDAFRQGLDFLDVQHQLIEVPYEGGSLPAIYYPGPDGANERPLIVAGTGFDGTQEELYFQVVAAALERGYSVLTYEGPGQGAPLREHGLTFTHEWEKPVGAILDAFLSDHPAPPKIVLLGLSMGGYLAPRAAAKDARIDGVVAFGVMYDFHEIGRSSSPPMVNRLLDRLTDAGRGDWVTALARLRARRDPGFKWRLDHSFWTLGVEQVPAMLERLSPFTLEGVAQEITVDVLALHGTDDHLIPSGQFDDFKAALVNARSVTMHLYDDSRGGHVHCQQGASTLWQEDFFDWLTEKFAHETTTASTGEHP